MTRHLSRCSFAVVTALLISMPAASRAQESTDTTLIHAELFDPVAQLLGLIPLRQVGAPNAGREVRVWGEAGHEVTGQLLRIVQTGGKTTGTFSVFWTLDSSETGAYGGNLSGQLKYRYGCAKVVQKMITANGIPVQVGECTATFKKAPDWKAVLDKLDALNVATLPDQSQSGAKMSDSETEPGVLGESRSGNTYHWFHYANVRTQTTDSAKQAAGILDVLVDLDKKASRDTSVPPR
jgi:hypothetical protein